MPKLTLPKSLTKVIKSTKTKDGKKSFTITFPKFKSGSLNVYLIFTIVIFAFIMGMLTIKVVDLQEQVSANKEPSAVATQTGGNGPSAPSAPAGPVNVAMGNYPIQGDSNAKVKVVEFADFRCPFCEQWFKNVEPNLIKDYVNTGKIQFAFRNYAFLGPASTLAAEASECANDQNQFWAFHDYMYKNQPDESDTSMYTNDNLTQIAGNLGMDTSQFSSCLSSKDAAQKAAKDLSDGQAAGVNGTPTTFINGVPIVGAVPYDQIKQQIDAALK